MTYHRILNLKLPAGRSAFLWGARKVGKSSFLASKVHDSTWFDLLKSDLFYDLIKQPSLLRQQIIAAQDAATLRLPVVIDEVQKIPALLDEVHWLIENRNVSFILCGSSARKLKRGHGNLLGGRAWRYEMRPLVFPEIPHFDLLRGLNHGLLPSHYHDEEYAPSLKAYIVDYLKEEIMEEGLARNIPAFSRFTDMLGYANGEIINFSNIGRDCGIDAKTVREYFHILEDTLIGFFLEPFFLRPKRDIILKAPKFYLCDPGIANYLSKRTIREEKGPEFGRSFEHYLIMETLSYSLYSGKDFPLRYWRTKSGQEIDLVLGDAQVAIEIKGANRIDDNDLKNLRAFIGDYKPGKAIIVSNERAPRKISDIIILPWRTYLQQLWDNEII